MTSPRQLGLLGRLLFRLSASPSRAAGGSSDVRGGIGRNGRCGGGLVERQLVVPGHRLRAYALKLRLELRKITEIPVHRREQEPRDGIELGQSAQRQLA